MPDNLNFDLLQERWMSRLDLKKQDLDIIAQQLPHPKYADFILNSFNFESKPNNENFQIMSYNNIKDPSWPECFTYQDLKKLPQSIINECVNIHGFDFLIYESNNITKERWDKFESGIWPIWELIRYKHIVLDVQQYLKDKKVLDFAAHAGIISLMALHVGAKFVKTTNVRPSYVKLANKMLGLSEFENKFSTEVADIHDYKNNKKICQDIDTVLLYGIMYHVHDHCQILTSVIDARPKNIIVDTFVPNSIIDVDAPQMHWYTETTDCVWHGSMQGYNVIPVGSPNYAWFKMFMELNKYKVVHYKKYFCNSHRERQDIYNQRIVIVFETTDL